MSCVKPLGPELDRSHTGMSLDVPHGVCALRGSVKTLNSLSSPYMYWKLTHTDGSERSPETTILYSLLTLTPSCKVKMPGGAAVIITGTADTNRVEAPVTIKAYLICAFAALGGIFFGYDTGYMSGVLGMKYFVRLYTGMPYPDPTDTAAVEAFHIAASHQSLIVSILSAGTFFGSIISGDIADFIGRRITIITGCIIFTIGCILQTASTSLGLMVPGRLIGGLGVGFVSAVAILYMSVSKWLRCFHSVPGLTPRAGNRT